MSATEIDTTIPPFLRIGAPENAWLRGSSLTPLVPLADDQVVYSIHRWVRIAVAEEYLRLGWIPQATLDGTAHGIWSVHMVWICPDCLPLEPQQEAA